MQPLRLNHFVRAAAHSKSVLSFDIFDACLKLLFNNMTSTIIYAFPLSLIIAFRKQHRIIGFLQTQRKMSL